MTEYRYYTDGFGMNQIWRWDGESDYTYKLEGGQIWHQSFWENPGEDVRELDPEEVPEWAK